MADFYAKMQKIASKTLAKYKQGEMSLDVYAPGTGPVYNPGAPTYTSVPFNGTARGTSAEELKNSLVQATDLVVSVPAGTLEPKLTDRVTIDGQQYSVVQVDAKPSAGTVVVWSVTIRA